MHVVLIGPNRGLGAALDRNGATISRVDGPGTGESLRSAGITEADLLVLTDAAEATAVPVALDIKSSLRVIVYAPETMPEFVRGQVDLAISPDVLEPDVVAEELDRPG
ncbi:MAG: CTP synthetase [Halobacteriales archaeon]